MLLFDVPVSVLCLHSSFLLLPVRKIHCLPLSGGGCTVGCAALGRTMLRALGLAKLGLFPVPGTSDEYEL